MMAIWAFWLAGWGAAEGTLTASSAPGAALKASDAAAGVLTASTAP